MPGVGFADGSFTIPNVPAGGFYVKMFASYYWTTQSTIDLGWDLLGRADVGHAVNYPLLSLAVTSPLQWHQYDELQVYTANLAFNEIGAYELSPPIDTLNWSNTWASLPVGATDTTYIFQLTNRPTPSGFLVALAAATSTPLTLQDGVPTNLTAALSTVLPAENFRLNIAGSAFTALRPGIGTNVLNPQTSLTVDAMPTGASLGLFGMTPDLLWYANGGVLPDADYGDVPYGNPFPASWTPVITLQDSVSKYYSSPTAANKVPVTGMNYTMTATMPSASTPITPQIGAVSNPMIGGSNFYSDLQNVGTTPTLSWQPPTVGTPTSYRIILYQFGTTSTGQLYSPRNIAIFVTTQQSFTIPEGSLQAGNMYYFRLLAMFQPTTQYDGHPISTGLPRSYAEALSGLIIP